MAEIGWHNNKRIQHFTDNRMYREPTVVTGEKQLITIVKMEKYYFLISKIENSY